ncbi:MarR family transcriptional regulator [Solidesulfovibrio sp.]|uniref:MarR family winged helix-turn-helix transcriptional regulator n=1 Tax=Solidesulfovibrio sp. TaxID=2910990 RepID=UPI00260DFA75|nr:MarR family transcriptional regulator [Solidesulfovibrio sp.]
MRDLFFDPEQSLGFMTITTNRLLCAALRRKMVRAGIDLTAEQWGVLIQLWNRDGLSQEELAQAACVDKSSMSRVLAGMERKGLIRRRPDPGDSRRKIVSTTDKAQAIKEGSRAVTREVLDAALADVRPQDRDVCLRVLATVKDTLLGIDT